MDRDTLHQLGEKARAELLQDDEITWREAQLKDYGYDTSVRLQFDGQDEEELLKEERGGRRRRVMTTAGGAKPTERPHRTDR